MLIVDLVEWTINISNWHMVKWIMGVDLNLRICSNRKLDSGVVNVITLQWVHNFRFGNKCLSLGQLI